MTLEKVIETGTYYRNIPVFTGNCIFCDNIFYSRTQFGKFCSVKCSQSGPHPQHRGQKSWNWKGGKYLNISTGYVCVQKRIGGKVTQFKEHRLIMEQHLGRKLFRNEVVHHINHNRSDNRIENLQLMTKANHAKLHYKENRRSLFQAYRSVFKPSQISFVAKKLGRSYGQIWRLKNLKNLSLDEILNQKFLSNVK